MTSTTEAIARAVSAGSVLPAPAALAKTTTTIALSKGAAATVSITTFVNGALKAMTWAKMKVACGVGMAVLLTGSIITVAVANKNPAQPDPITLLKWVAAAREKINSGETEYLVARHDYQWNIQTNYGRLKVAFDGEKRRFEQLQRESAYVSTDPGVQKQVDTKRAELNGDDDALAQLGLIKFQDAHYRTIYDGKTITQFDPRIYQAKLCDPKEGFPEYLFDPRRLGLPDWFGVADTVESCLTWRSAKRVLLIGKEMVEGTACWHVQTQIPMIVDSTRNLSNTWEFDYWIDAVHPQRVIKAEDVNRGGTFISQYDEQNPSDPLPVEVDATEHFGGDPRPWETRMYRRNTRYNVPIESKAFTLAGLGMPIGTDVVDYWISRSLGYWNGANLSQKFPFNAAHSLYSEAAAEMKNNPESLARDKTDGSFVDERRIVLRRTEIGVARLVLIFVAIATIGRFRSKNPTPVHSTAHGRTNRQNFRG
ncbi:MAG TPA: hypothetical protein VGY56_14960 [Verrucomicrobiae bacterium]|nr:hypothetical protein [Verrucomicrobiae bacterium]